MKTPQDLSDLIRRLPSAGDLLDKPQIKGLIDRVEGLDVTSGVRHFVDRMRREVSRRSLDMPIPSIGELADRAARFILGRHVSEPPQVINATGQLWPVGLSGPPLADDAIAALSAALQHYHVAAGVGATSAVARAAGAGAAVLFNSPNASMLLAMASLAGGEPIVVARGELGTLDAGTRLTDLATQAGVAILEVGAADAVELADYERALASGAKMVLRIESLPHAVSGQTHRPSIDELAAVVAKHSGLLVHDIGRGPLAPLPDAIPLEVISATESLASGASLVVARGDGYLGGPACGLALGHEKSVAKIANHPLHSTVALSPQLATALEATLGLHRDPDRASLSIPTLAFLSTPLENLRSRAERLAAQIAVQPGIASAVAKEIPAAIDLGGTQPLASFGIQIECKADSFDRIAKQMEENRPRLLGVQEGEGVRLDLRIVAPDDDIALVAAFDAPNVAVETE